jgi:signal transduction histidine kinase
MSLFAMQTPVSIRRRMLTALLWTSVVWGLAAPLMVVLTIRHEINELLDDTLRASAQALSGIVHATPPLNAASPVPLGGLTIHAAGDYVRGRFAWQLVGPAGFVLIHSSHAPVEPLVSDGRTGLLDAASGWRVLGVPIGEGQTLYVAQSMDERSEALRDAALNTMMASLVVWAVCVVWLLRRMRSELAQISRLVRDVQEHDPMDPAKALPPVTRAELLPIREAIDDLGARLAVRVRNERAFTAHAAHALRTPLAGMDAQLAVALRECAPEQQPRLQRVRDAASRFARVVSALLTLFRSGAALNRQAVDVGGMLARLPVAGLGVQILETGQTLRPVADPDLLAAALANLLDNASRHGARQLRIQVGGDRLTLDDDGPGIDDERLRTLQAALDREDYTAFTGLGLVLSDLIARAHGGRLLLGRSALGGLRVDMTLATGLSPAQTSLRPVAGVPAAGH